MLALGLIITVLPIVYGYENIAFNNPTYQAHVYYSSNRNYGQATFDSSNAVDGLKSVLTAYGGQCTISADGYSNLTWWVNLTSIHSIHDITIYYRTDDSTWGFSNGYTTRFLGFYVYVSNTTNRHHGYLCLHDEKYTRATIPAVVNIRCPVHGQYVIYYNERPQPSRENAWELSQYAHVELCEVEVNGCQNVGVYGPDCSLPCPDTNCRYCHIETGACLGCKPGYKGHQCELQCDNGTYGSVCGESCGACQEYKQCHHINGSCLEGCDSGFEGDLCKDVCSDGKFGITCMEQCDENCGVPSRCNRTTGECLGGCQPGFEGLQCKNECLNKRFGKNCSQHCGKCLDGDKCHNINGTCLNGCIQGYKDLLCLTVCDPGTYGMNCLKNCSSHCVNNTCNPHNGECPAMSKTSPQQGNGNNIGTIIGGVSGITIACIVVVIAVLTLKRRRSLKKDNRSKADTNRTQNSNKEIPETNFSSINSNHWSSTDQGNKSKKTRMQKLLSVQKRNDEVDEDVDEQIHSENPYGDFYANEVVIRDIPLEQLDTYIAEKRKNKDDGFQREYATLPYGERYKCEAGKREENLLKNRYKTTFPYDHSRILLKTDSASDYINANYIQGAKQEQQYIAAQGPKQNTVNDFWTMVWQEHVSIIVMLTNLKEGNKTKCAKYWPEVNQNIIYGKMSVKMIEEKEYAFYSIRKFNINDKESKRPRFVTQYHYTAWPDHGTPEPLCLVVFLYHVTKTGTNKNDSPIDVHCSAGIGRTGTYIAIDVLNKIGRKTGKVNVAEYVKKMRESRMNMVQTYEQYMTIFLSLNEIFKSPVMVKTIEEFTANANAMTVDKPANQNTLRKEFQLLMKIQPKYNEDDFKLARDGCGDIHSSRLLPLDKYSVHLSSTVLKRGNFINAVSVPSYTNSRAFIVTQYPTEEDAVDFLRLLNDHESDTVVCMDPLHAIDSSKTWLPRPSSLNAVPPFTIHIQNRSESDLTCTTLHILEKNNEEEVHTVTVIEPKISIHSSGTPLDTSQLRSLVSATLNIETETPITIVSSDGAALCGVFCAVHNVIQQINMDNCVDICTAVRQLQVRRPEFCSNLDEYRLVINAVYDHIQGSDTSIYYNQ
ncbi:receptor-type tyrosine-protein phosphatase alpha-like isoform X3 [Saccostrea cucullata]|uniref:receptor-type tyrosine-protein phosphatase alpha-like isoform X3 n=1 Tax=Saccostrea cuccullata TaxID=36930 RepID=UPI002ED1520E